MVKPRMLGGSLQEIPDELRGDAAGIDRLLDALDGRRRDAETVTAACVALRLASGIVCSAPTEAELSAGDAALGALAEEAQPVEPTFLRLVGADARYPEASC